MALQTYSDLRTAVLAWMVRSDPIATERVPDLIRLGETRLFRRLRLSGMVSLPYTLTVPAGQNWVALPDDWLAFRRIGMAGPHELGYVTADTLFTLPEQGDPRAYTIEGRRFTYGQTPAADLAIPCAYYQRPKPLDLEPSNWVLNDNPDLYLYAALLEAWQWAQNSQKAGEYGTLLDRAIDDAMSSDKAAMISGGILRMRRP